MLMCPVRVHSLFLIDQRNVFPSGMCDFFFFLE